MGCGEVGASEWLYRLLEAEDGPAVTEEGLACEALGDDVSAVIRRVSLAQVDGSARETPADHGVPGSHPAGRLLEALAPCAVNHGLGVGEEDSGPGRATPTSMST